MANSETEDKSTGAGRVIPAGPFFVWKIQMHIYYLQKPEAKTNHTSQYLGVSWHKTRKKWKASISIYDRKKILGYFDKELEAARCYNDAAKKHGRDTLNILP